MRRTYRHHGWQRDAARRNATLEPLGKPGGSRAFSADGPPQAPVAPRRSCEAKEWSALRLEARRYPTVSWSMNKDDEYRRTAAEALREPPSIRLMVLLRSDERLSICLLIGV